MTTVSGRATIGRGLAIEAALWLTLARFGLRLFGFRRLVATMRSGSTRRLPPSPLVERIAAAIERRAVRGGQGCLPRAFAAAWMLQVRGFRPTLHYGVRRQAGEMQAHVWLEVCGVPVVGKDQAAGYSLLRSFPTDAEPTGRNGSHDGLG